MRRNTMKTLTLAFAASLLLAQAAGAREFADIYTDCGLGALIAPRTPAVAAVTNVTFDLGTTAIISNVSSPETCQGGKALAAAFINAGVQNMRTPGWTRVVNPGAAYREAKAEREGAARAAADAQPAEAHEEADA